MKRFVTPSVEVDYYPEKDIVYVRAQPLPAYRVREPYADFLVYVSREDNETIIGFEILDFSLFLAQGLAAPEVAPYLALVFHLPEAGLKALSLRDILMWASGRFLLPEKPAVSKPLHPAVQLR